MYLHKAMLKGTSSAVLQAGKRIASGIISGQVKSLRVHEILKDLKNISQIIKMNLKCRVSLAVWPVKPTLAAEETKVETWHSLVAKWQNGSEWIRNRLTLFPHVSTVTWQPYGLHPTIEQPLQGLTLWWGCACHVQNGSKWIKMDQNIDFCFEKAIDSIDTVLILFQICSRDFSVRDSWIPNGQLSLVALRRWTPWWQLRSTKRRCLCSIH